MNLENISQAKVFGGWHKQYTHTSTALDCDMRFAIFLPPNATKETPVPVVYWLSGLTCTDENFMQKAGAFRKAAELGIAIVAPDTSPRGDKVPDDPNGAYDFGLGAGFYLNATQAPWSGHYQMYSYIVDELPNLIEAHFPVTQQRAISGHSMGGHGALTIGLKHPDSFCSISAFSPIVNPMNCPWGKKAFHHYLGDDRTTWAQYDSVELLKTQSSIPPILIDQGDSDSFLTEQLQPEKLMAAAEQTGHVIELRMQTGYDHSYFFIQSFIEEHLDFHATHLFPNTDDE
ncbi:S-formylglutathione hydrolase [Vibrio agarivorans]|uniref:S-formylglutathione hydrolase n=1 Tax=Vibrio agarivorans TaxID=153622 RepID=A0ABT7Y1D6_9VIBR|nr:S-formylglutathione hydrolase [Vibrio agarivorans]MDN2481848.1 S-formylglutathione hydrolase [Vibrio agarivorans]